MINAEQSFSVTLPWQIIWMADYGSKFHCVDEDIISALSKQSFFREQYVVDI